MEFIAIIFYVAAAIDFVSSWLGYNLTYFLGEASRFSPIILVGIGFVIQKLGESGGAGLRQSEDDSLPEQYRTKSRKKTQKSK